MKDVVSMISDGVIESQEVEIFWTGDEFERREKDSIPLELSFQMASIGDLFGEK